MQEQGAPVDRVDVGGDVITFRVTSEQSGGAAIAYDVSFAPGGGPPMLHRHQAFELFRVDAGELAFYLEDESGETRRSVAGSGDVVAIPPNREHTVRNESEAEARALAVLSPGAEMERFARGAGRLSGHGTETRVDEVLALAAASGIEITRPLTALT
jgi:oxalate decarboxylase/phosphoglucose isomerase-like protein (cupin superfamily)